MDIPSTLATLKAAMDVGKIVIESGKSLSEADLKLRIVELITALSDARTGIAELQEQLRERAAEIADLKRQAQLVREMTWEAPFYWRMADNKRDGPFCQKCFDDKQKAARLIEFGGELLKCHVCGTVYDGPGRAAYVRSETEKIRSFRGHDPFA